jgi:hypothetical protein
VVAGGDDCNDNDATVSPGTPEVWGDGIDQDCDGIADVAGGACIANFTVEFPDGSSTTLDGCLDWSLAAAFEFDPDDPPDVRSFTLNFGATTSTGFECEVTVFQDEVCGTGYYDAADAANTTSYALMDCSGVANQYEQTYTASTGYLHVATLDTGSVSGNFTSLPLETTVEGYLSVDDGTGVSLSGSFSLTLEQVVTDEEQQTVCAVSDGDEDDDGEVDAYYDGTDCDDSNAAVSALSTEICDGQDNDCNGLDDAGNPGVDDQETDNDTDGQWECEGDCDDADINNYSGNTEVCDNADNDCDTVVDNGLGVDGDTDGHADPSSCVTDATLPIPYDDCDDADINNYPGNTEVCDGQDNDCDGSSSCQQAPVVSITSPADQSGFGLAMVVPLRGQVTDDEVIGQLTAVWSSNQDGNLAVQTPPTSGELELDIDNLSIGLHEITLTVTDDDGLSGSETIELHVHNYSFSVAGVCLLLGIGDTITLNIAPAAPPPLTWSMLEAPSGGSIDAATGVYTAGTTPWVTDVIQVADGNGVAATAEIQVLGTWTGSVLPISGDPYSASRSYRVSSADYDFDQDIDFIVANIGSGYDRIFVNDGSGGMTESTPFPLTASREIKFIDYDGDHFYDVAFGGSDSSGSHLYQNNQDTTFTEVQSWGSSSEDCLGMAVGDLDGDAFPDIVCAHNQDAHPTDMTILFNVSDGAGGRTFSQTYFYGPATSSDPEPAHMSQALSLADVDGDGDLDLAVGGSNYNNPSGTHTPVQNLLCSNDGTGTLTCANAFGTGRTNEVAFADLDGDGDSDLIVSNNQQPLTVWWNDGTATATFTEDQAAVDATVNMGGVRQFGIDDIDGDNDIDLVVAQGGATSSATAYFNSGDGSFCPYPLFDAGQAIGSRGITASHLAELNGDGVLDLVVTRYRGSNDIWLSQ